MRNLVSAPGSLPIRFRLGETLYTGMPEGARTEKENGKTVYTAMLGDLEVRAVCVSYEDFDASEWTVYFTNTGTEPSPRLSWVDVIDTLFEGENPRIITCNGDYCSPDGYASTETRLSCGAELQLVPRGGRSCDGAFPYQRILFDGKGINLAVGWPGQWKCTFHGTDTGVRYTAGQEILDSVVLPGETLRTPMIVAVAFDGELEQGINVWRRWYRKYVGIAKPYLQGSFSGGGLEFTHATEENQLAAIRRSKENGIGINLWWLDAGWYYAKDDEGNDDWWGTVGDWEPDPSRFPRGLGPVGEECEKQGLSFLLWFESERVTEHSKVLHEHPEWIIEEDGVMMLDLSQSACVDYLTAKIGGVIEESHVKIYRQDYNFEPEHCWRSREAEDRRGAVENLYEQGYLRFWDALKARFPDLQIDSCASGGRRNDIETMRRAVPMHETDYGYGIQPIQQAFFSTLYTWIPYFRGFNSCWEREDGSYDDGKPLKALPEFDEYTAFCSLAPMVSYSQFSRGSFSEEVYEKVRRYAQIFYHVSPILCGSDFYALTPYHKSRERWTAWQFDMPEENSGIIQVIRNNSAPEEALTVTPRLGEGSYIFRNLWDGRSFRWNGGTLTFRQPLRSAEIWEYSKETDGQTESAKAL